MKNSRPPLAERRGVATGLDPLARRLDADQPHVGIREERREDADRVRSAADARHDRMGQPAVALQHLRSAFAADHRLEISHHPRERIGTDDGADDVVCGRDVGHPVPQRLVGRVLERARARGHRHHRGPQQLHAIHIEPLPPHVFLAHVDHALEPEFRAHRRGCDAMLPRSRLGDDAPLPHPPGEQRLPQSVVDLVGAGVVQVLALQDHSHPAPDRLGETRHFGQRRGPPGVIPLQPLELLLERRVALGGGVDALQLRQCRHQRLGDVAAAEGPEAAGRGRG